MKSILLSFVIVIFSFNASAQVKLGEAKMATSKEAPAVEAKTVDLEEMQSIEMTDSQDYDQKAEHLKENNIEADAWKDLKCGNCQRRCCSPCTADGDRSRCAQTKFTNCRICGHASSGHYGVSH
ncbi:MAG: hypothetical protein RIE58_01315 [Vicingaceae bacterium]